MEDSGREKPKAPEGAVANKEAEAKDTQVEFHSAAINKIQKDEHFTNVEGAEERARVAQKVKEDARKRRDEEIKQAIKDEKPRMSAEKKKKLTIIIAISAVLILTALGIVFILQKKKDDYKKSDEAYAKELLAQAIDMSGYNESISDYAMGLEVFTNAKAQTSDNNRLGYIYVAEAEYAIDYFARDAHARELLDSDVVKNNEALVASCFYQKVDYSLSIIEGNTDRMIEIEEGGCLNEK